MVICPISLDDNYGVFDKDGDNCLMLDMDEAHEVGLAKYDFLILRNVEIIRDTCRYAGIPYPKSYQVDFNDQKVWQDMMRSPVGIFQMEKDYAFGMLKQYGAKSIEDMTLVTACIRPSGASYRDELIAHKPHHNPSPIIDELLKSNGGYLVYQEDTIKFLQQICGLSGGEADNVRRAIGRKQKDRLDAALPSILEGYCNKSPAPREQAEQEAKEFLQIIEDSASYQFGYNHAIAYSIVGYYCAWLRCYYPIEFITALLNNAANDEDIAGGTELAKKYGIKVENPKWGISQGHYEFDREKNTIAKGLESVKYMGAAAAKELYDLSHTQRYTYFVDVLRDIVTKTSVNSRQTDLLIKIDFFSEFGNQRELLRIVDMFNLFKQGDAKQIKRDVIDGSSLEGIVKKYATGVTRSGGVAKSYTLLDVMAVLRGAEDLIKAAHMEDLSDLIKIKNFEEIMGYVGYTSGKDADRRKLFLLDVKQLRRKSDGAQFGYSFYTKSIGSGKESRFTVFNRVYNKSPVHKGDIIYCISFDRDGAYYTMTDYRKVV
jgi:DNA polymerase-3 subunit alpha